MDIKGKFDHLLDLVMPAVEEETIQEKTQATVVQMRKPQVAVQAEAAEEAYETRQVANGAPVYVSVPVAEQETTEQAAAPIIQSKAERRRNLKVHTTKAQELNVEVFVPRDFDHVTVIADELKSGKAAVVNYEQIEASEQRRICDFVNGVCYVLDGAAKRISEYMVLYVPANVEVNDIKPVPVED